MVRWGFWRNRTHNLARMSLGDLVVAFFSYYAVLVYLGFAAAALWLTALWFEGWLPLFAGGVFAAVVYPLAWYLIHRWVLHGQYLYRSQLTAKVWKRIHFDHHQDPHNLVVLFGALYTTIPAIALVTIPVGYLIGGKSAAALAFAIGIFSTVFYEFCHCVQHLNTTPKTAFMRQVKKYHLAHHFHNEQGNFGITNYLWDRLFGTFYPEPKLRPKSATVFNIGYTDEMAQRYPWVAALLFVNGVQVERTALPPDAAAADLKHYRETLPNGRSYEIVEISDAHFLDILPETLVEPGHYFVMGDHRDASNDSRNPEFGAIALEAIEDRASVIWLSSNWRRIGKNVQPTP